MHTTRQASGRYVTTDGQFTITRAAANGGRWTITRNDGAHVFRRRTTHTIERATLTDARATLDRWYDDHSTRVAMCMPVAARVARDLVDARRQHRRAGAARSEGERRARLAARALLEDVAQGWERYGRAVFGDVAWDDACALVDATTERARTLAVAS